jgi:hypothetical protein
MTREEILSMKPGMELDYLIAEHVFKNIRNANGKTYYKNGLVKWTDDKGANFFYPVIPKYSSEIADAWDLIEHLQVNDTYIGVHCWCHFPKSYAVDYQGPGKHKYETIGPISTAPEAICKAALLAVLNA